MDMLERVSRQMMPLELPVRQSPPQENRSGSAQALSFGQALQQELSRAQGLHKEKPPVAVEFSRHALVRAAERGIEVTEELMAQLTSGVERAQAKGARNIIALDATRAFIVNVPNAKVITAIHQDEMRQNVFTNIDGAVFL